MAADDLKDLKPVYLIHGSEELLLDRAVARLTARLAKAGEIEHNMRVFDGEIATGDEIVNDANTLPFMSERRLVVVRRADKLPAEATGALAAYAADPNPTTTLVLVAIKIDRRSKLYKAVDALGGVAEYKPPGRGQYPAQVVEMFRDRGKRIGVEAATVLVEAVGEDLRRLSIEVEKVCSYAGDTETLTRDDVERVMSLTAPTSIWEFVDAVGLRDVREALRLLADLLGEGETVLGVWAMTVRHMRQLAMVKALSERGLTDAAIASEAGLKPWQPRKLRGQVNRFEVRELEDAISRAAAAEAEMKTSRDARLVFERWIAVTCGQPR